MNYEPLDIIQEIIEANPSITDLIGKTGTASGQIHPNVAQEDVPDDMERPYIVLRLESDRLENNDLLGSALISADIYTEGDRTKARQIARAIEKVVHNKQYGPGSDHVGAGAIKSFTGPKHDPPQPDPSVKCTNLKIMLTYYRDDLLEP